MVNSSNSELPFFNVYADDIDAKDADNGREAMEPHDLSRVCHLAPAIGCRNSC